MTFLGFTGAINFVTCLVVSVLVAIKNIKNPLNRSFFNLNLSVALYSFGYFFWQLTKEETLALFWFKVLSVGIILINITYLYFVFQFLGLIEEKRKLLRKLWFINIIFIILNLTSNLYTGLVPRYNLGFWPVPTVFFHLYLSFWFWQCLYGFYWLIKELRKSKGLKQLQIKYFTISAMFGFVGGATNWPMWYNIHLTPYFNITISLYIGIVAYAIFRYSLIDIKLAITRAGIFAVVYTIVLGIPFGLAGWRRNWLISMLGQGWFWIPMFILLALATFGPYIYTSLRRQTEERLLKEEHRAHHLLMQASSGITQERNLKKLLNLIVHFIPKIMRLKNASIFLLNEESTQLTLEAIRYKNNLQRISRLDVNDPLIDYIKGKRAPLVYEEMKSKSSDNDISLPEILSQMKTLSASVIFPCFVEDTLLGFLILDDKKSGRIFTPEDLNVLSTLTNQAALAIENAQFYERDRENQALLYQSATLADMGVMADSMGHQIKNHIQKMMAEAGGNAGILEGILQQGIDNEKALELLKRQIDILYSIEKQGEAGSRLIESISKFSRLPKAVFREITLKEILDTANDILRFKVKFDEIDYNVHIPDNFPILYAHPILSEAFVNLIDNAYDAIREKEQEIELESKNTTQPVSYRGSISLSATQQNDSVEIQVKDNGIGIKKENTPNLFLPFYTTKATSAKGTGLGLFVIKKIVSNHKGTIKIDSEYMQGTTFTITLPIRQEKIETTF